MAAAKNRWQSGLPSPLPLRTFATSLTSRDKPNLSGLEFQNERPPPPPSNETPTERSLRLEREELARKKRCVCLGGGCISNTENDGSQEIDAVIEEARLQREHRRSQRKVLLLGEQRPPSCYFPCSPRACRTVSVGKIHASQKLPATICPSGISR